MPIEYSGLEEFILNEIPYKLKADSYHTLNLANPEAELPAIEVMSFSEEDLKRPTEEDENRVTRYGLLGENSQVSADPGPSVIEAHQIAADDKLEDQTYRLVTAKGREELMIGGRPLRITKVVAVPYQWSRDGDPFPRQTFILVCYNGPDGG